MRERERERDRGDLDPRGDRDRAERERLGERVRERSRGLGERVRDRERSIGDGERDGIVANSVWKCRYSRSNLEYLLADSPGLESKKVKLDVFVWSLKLAA